MNVYFLCIGKAPPPQSLEEEMEVIDSKMPKHIKAFYKKRIENGDKTIAKETPIWKIEV